MRLTVGSSPYLQLLLRWAGCLHMTPAECRLAPAGRLARATFAAKSDYVDRPLPAAARAALASWIERRQADSDRGSGAILLDSYGGAINRVAPVEGSPRSRQCDHGTGRSSAKPVPSATLNSASIRS